MSLPSRERPSVLVTHRFELCTAFVIGALGLGLGLGIPADQTLAHPYDKLVSVSSENNLQFTVQNDPVEKHRQVLQVSGWLYFLAWSLSFYPQFLLNWRTKSVVGFSFDYAACNLLGFLCYSIFNAAFYWDDSVQQEYRDRHKGHENAVHLNDVFFAGHGAILVALTFAQCFIYERGSQSVSRICSSVIGAASFAALVSFCLVLFDSSRFPMLTFLYYLSWVKMGVTFFKYMPQVWLNYKRQSTVGWNINQVLLDFTGGVFSVFQLCMEAYAKDDMSAITGDPVKFGLGSVSIVFDIMFMVQHYCLYKSNNTKLTDDAAKGYTMVSPDQLNASTRDRQGTDEQRLLASATTSISEEGVSGPQLSTSNSMDVVSIPHSPPNESEHEV